MGINVGRAKSQASSLGNIARDLRNINKSISNDESKLLQNWSAKEVQYITAAIDSIQKRMNDAASKLDDLGNDISSVAEEIRREEEAEAKRLKEKREKEAEERAKAAADKNC